MSHSFTIVILANPLLVENESEVSRKIKIESAVSRLLAPFNEELEIPTWWAKCWCIGAEAAMEEERNV